MELLRRRGRTRRTGVAVAIGVFARDGVVCSRHCSAGGRGDRDQAAAAAVGESRFCECGVRFSSVGRVSSPGDNNARQRPPHVSHSTPLNGTGGNELLLPRFGQLQRRGCALHNRRRCLLTFDATAGCPTNKLEHKQAMVMCPSKSSRNYDVCIYTEQLCDGINNCPGREDEDATNCFFYKTVRAERLLPVIIANVIADA